MAAGDTHTHTHTHTHTQPSHSDCQKWSSEAAGGDSLWHPLHLSDHRQPPQRHLHYILGLFLLGSFYVLGLLGLSHQRCTTLTQDCVNTFPYRMSCPSCQEEPGPPEDPVVHLKMKIPSCVQRKWRTSPNNAKVEDTQIETDVVGGTGDVNKSSILSLCTKTEQKTHCYAQCTHTVLTHTDVIHDNHHNPQDDSYLF